MLSRRHILLTAGASLALAGAARGQGASGGAKVEGATGAEAQLNKALDDFFAQDMADNPEVATSLGLDIGANAAAKSKLSQASVADLDRYKRRTAQQLARLRAIDRKALTGMAAVNYDSVAYDLDTTDRGNRRFAYGGEGAGPETSKTKTYSLLRPGTCLPSSPTLRL